MKKGALVCFTGLDGAGKTSLAKAVVSDLWDQGLDARYVYLRYQPILLRPVIMALNRTLLKKESFNTNYSGYSKAKFNYSEKHPFLSSLYQSALLFDYYLQVFVKLKIPLATGKNIVCDRYVFDTVATDLSIDFNLSSAQVVSYLKTIFKVFPKPNLCFFIDIPEEDAFRRKSDIPSIEYLKDRKWAYLIISKSENMIVLDGLNQPDALRAEVGEIIRGVVA